MRIEFGDEDVREAIKTHAAKRLDTVAANIGDVQIRRHKGGAFTASVEMIATKTSGPRKVDEAD